MEKNKKIIFNIIIIIAIVLLSIATIPKNLQEDTYYMIKVGEYICENGIGVITERIEPFAWHTNMIYTYPHWLLDIVFYLIYNIAGFAGIYGATVLAGIIIYLLIYYTNTKVSKNNIISAVIALISIWFLRGFITARAQIVTYVCCILTILFIERFLETKKNRYAIGLIIVPIVLANCHAALFPIYFVLYLPYIAEYIASFFTRKEILNRRLKSKNKKLLKAEGKNDSEKVEKIKSKIVKIQEKLNKKRENSKIIIERNDNVKWLIAIFIICLFTGLLTPLKDIPYTYTIRSIRGNTMNFISEHQAVQLIKYPELLIIFAILACLLFSNKIKIKLRDLFMLAGMSILAIVSYKQFPIFWIGIMCILNKLISMVINNDFKEKIISIFEKILKPKAVVFGVMIAIIIALCGYKNLANQNYVDTKAYPVAAVKWMKENLDVKYIRLFNDFNYGSYLLFQDIPVFIDGRADAYDPEFNKDIGDVYIDYMTATSAQVWYGNILSKYKITHVITNKNSILDTQLQRDTVYKMIYDDGNFAIYAR